MTLKEKLMKESWNFEFPISNLQANNIIQIADEFAIDFAEWVIDTDNKPVGQFTIKQLLEIFKKEKGL